ncbi:hypothetical protein [Helicobacter canadensis]|nr:hypothetical protein [Helicobacter canadensis]EFR48859.1 hypothetical protein HCMG_01032 [Helicobacter canadensis MIT 98-5491]
MQCQRFFDITNTLFRQLYFIHNIESIMFGHRNSFLPWSLQNKMLFG